MIVQLVRTRFESNLMSFLVFMALIVVAGARFLMTREVPQGPVPPQQILQAGAWLMLCCLAAGLVSLLRQNRERSGRLYAQLPVSPRQARIAYWLHVCLYPGIAALLLHAVIRFGGSEPSVGEARIVPIAFFLATCLWIACFALVTSNIARVIPESVRKNTVLYCVVVTLATLVLGGILILTVQALLGEFRGGADFKKTFASLGAVLVVLVMLDVHLFGKNDGSLT